MVWMIQWCGIKDKKQIKNNTKTKTNKKVEKDIYGMESGARKE